MFRLTREEATNLRSQIVISSLSAAWGGRRYLPYAFTEQGVAMLSSVLRSRRAIETNIAIMRTFVRLRQMLLSHEGLARKLEALEKKYDAQFKVVFDAIRELMSETVSPRPAIGFRPQPSDSAHRTSEKTSSRLRSQKRTPTSPPRRPRHHLPAHR